MRLPRVLVVVATLGAMLQPGAPLRAETPSPDVVRYDAGRLTVRVTEVPLDHLLAEIAAVTHAVVRGEVSARPISIDFKDAVLSDGLTRIFGAESFMLTYAGSGEVRMIEILGNGPPPSPAPAIAAMPTPSVRPPLAEEEDQAVVLQRPVAVAGPLAKALGSEQPPVGRVLHAALQERDLGARAAARNAALNAIASDPEVEAAYLSTLAPVDDAVLAKILRASATEGAAEEWLMALAARAPSAELRAKAAAVLTALRQR